MGDSMWAILLSTVLLHSAMTKAELSFKCPADGIFPNPDDCGTFISCSGLVPVLMPCGPGTLFDPVDKVCKTPDQVACKAGSTSTSTTTTTTTPVPSTQTTAPTVQTTSTTIRTSTSPAPTTTGKPTEVNCPATGFELVPNPDTCNSFYVCIEGRYEIENCPEGYGFNHAQQRCTLEDNDCKPNGQGTTPSPDDPSCSSEGEQRMPNPKDCKSFYVCLGGFLYIISCPVNSQYDKDAERCLEAASEECGDFVTPNPIDKICAGLPDGILLPNPDDCSTFYHCSHGKALVQSCPPGLLFDGQDKTCTTDAMAQCQ